MKLIVKYFLLADILFSGFILDLDKYIFLWQVCFFWGGHLRLRVILHLSKYSIYTDTYMWYILCHFSELLNYILVTVVATVVVHIEADCDPCEVHCDRILMLFY